MPFFRAPCPITRRHAPFLNQMKMPYILEKNHEYLTKTKEVTVFFQFEA